MREFHGHRLITSLTLITLLLPLFSIFFYLDIIHLPKMAYYGFIFWLIIAIIFSFISYKEFVVGYLTSLFALMVAWRITGLYDLFLIDSFLLGSFLLMLGNFFVCANENLTHPEQFRHRVSLAGWQLIFIRLYIGLDLVPHFTEKLFAGSDPHLADVTAFTSLGLSHADFFVWLAGLCEFGTAIALCLGLFLRLGALGGAIYLLIATYLGHHFSLGFIWAGKGGGWEFAIMWLVLILSYAFTGYNEFTVDQYLEDRFKVPQWLKSIM